jgi:hypothetical protein
MKYVPKFQLGFYLSWQTIVPPGHAIFAWINVSFPCGSSWGFNYLCSKIAMTPNCHDLCLMALLNM